MGLLLNITCENKNEYALSIGKDTNDFVEPTLNGIACKVELVDISFNKQMYQPGKIVARLHFTASKYKQGDNKSFFMLNWEFLEKEFLKGSVKLEDSASTNVIASSYKVYKVIPHYTSESLYVDLIIYSPDYALTTESECKTYTAKKLGSKILSDKFGSSNCKIVMQNQLKHGSDEYIHPYLVQYNESFYDFLIRTANRWGEFVYYEGDKLIVGRKIFRTNTKQTDKDGNEVKNGTADVYQLDTKKILSSSYQSISYSNANTRQSVTNDCNKAVVTDEYLDEVLKSEKPKFHGGHKDQTGNEYILQKGDMYSCDAGYHHKILQSICNMKGNVCDWFLNTMIDDGIAASQNEDLLTTKESEYNDSFNFNNSLSDEQYEDTNKKKCRQFATFADGGGLTSANYTTVLGNELKAGEGVLTIDLDKTYTHLRLGEVFNFDGDETYYLVTGIECSSKPEDVVINGKKEKKMFPHFHVTAIKAVETKKTTYSYVVSNNPKTYEEDKPIFFPLMLPTGHIRFSGPQTATVITKTETKKESGEKEEHKLIDPLMNGRYRIKNSWDTNGTDLSPWIRVSREMMSEESGGVWELENNTEVLIDFMDGNVELPYIVGALQENKKRWNNRGTMFNKLDLTTPAGHAIRLSDGEGGGAANFMASFVPLAGWIKGFYPQKNGLGDYGGYSKYYDGEMELTDKFGIYSIKASTDKRNISIKSPYGDVKLNAFTGITISAPNGDVKIQGKNVSIEAGNKLSIVSGKNIYNGFLGSGIHMGGGEGGANGWAIASDVANTIGKKVAEWCDLSIIRDGIEIFLRPIGGTLEIKSYRNMLLQAGIKKEDTDGEKLKKLTNEPDFMKVFGQAGEWIMKNWNILDVGTDFTHRFMDTEDNNIWRAPSFGTIQLKSVTNKAEYWESTDVFGGTNNPAIPKGNYLGMDNNTRLALAQKAEISDLSILQTWAIGLFATRQDMSNTIDDLVDTRDKVNRLASSVAKKVNLTAFQQALDRKADKGYVDVQLDQKADRDYVDAQLDQKANRDYVDAQLGQKANKDYVDAQLKKKADKTELDEAKAATANLIKDLQTKFENHTNSKFWHVFKPKS